jgi:hypothetical protein
MIWRLMIVEFAASNVMKENLFVSDVRLLVESAMDMNRSRDSFQHEMS